MFNDQDAEAIFQWARDEGRKALENAREAADKDDHLADLQYVAAVAKAETFTRVMVKLQELKEEHGEDRP